MSQFIKYKAKHAKNLAWLVKSASIFTTAIMITGSIFYYSYNLPTPNQSNSVSGRISDLAYENLKDISSGRNLLNNKDTKNDSSTNISKLIKDSEKYSELSFIIEENIKDIIEKKANAKKITDGSSDAAGDDKNTIYPDAPEEVGEILDGTQENDTGTKIIIKYKDESEALKILEENSSILSGAQVQLLDKNLMSVQLPESVSVDEAIEYFSQRDDIENVEQDYDVEALYIPNDTYYNNSQWNLKAIKADLGWDLSNGGSSDVVVAVIDTGVAYENYGEYVKASDFSSSTFITGYDFVNNDAHPNDDHGHGTHVAGTIAQSTNNGFGCAGVAYNVKVMPLKVLNSYGSGSYSNVIAAIYYAADHGADVINMSLGGGSYLSSAHDAIKYAKDHNVTVVCAAGNSNSSVIFPAAYPESVAVGSVNSSLNKSAFSCYGDELDFVAPGESILQETLIGNGNYYTNFYYYSGTSMASPHVAALAALILSQYPGIGSSDVEAFIKNGCRDLGSSGFDSSYGYGLINVYNSLSLANKPYITTLDTNGFVPIAGQDQVTVNGVKFGTGDIPGTESYVMIGTLKLPSDDAAISSWSDNQIVIDLPEAAKPSSVYVAVGFNKSNSVSLDINNAPALSFVSPSASITANSGAFIDWIVTDTNNDAVTVKLFYDTDSQGYDGIQLGGDFSLAVSSYIWDTSQMAEATYCIYAVYQDEHGAARSMYMPYDITIDHIYTVNNLSLYTHTASGWKYGITAPAGWKDLGFDDSSWKDAVNTRYNNTSSYMPSNLFAAKMGPEAKWISGVESKSRYYFRKLVFLDSESVKNANVKITAVGSFKLYVNGTHIGSGSNWKSLNCFDISEYAVPGLNIVCVDAVTTNAKGFTAGIFLNEKKPQVTSADPAHPLAGADSFTISGTDFGTGDIPGTESYVMIGTLKLPSDDAAISSWSDNQIVIDLPEAAKPSSVYVAVGFNKSNSVSLDINNAPALSFVSPSASITANSGAFIDWIVTDTNNDAVTVKLFYDTDSQGYDGIQLGGDFSLAVSSYIWDTSQMAEATYCIYAVYQDEHGAARSMYMPYDITIDHIYTVNNLSLYTHTASGWKYGITAPAGWKDLGFDDSSWKDAVNTRYNNTSSYMPSNLFAAKMGPEAKWISGVESKSRYYFRKLVFLDSESVKNANVKITAVGSFKLYVNGTHIGSGSNWKSLNCFDISEYAVPGLNIVCVDAVTTNAKGFTAGIFLNEKKPQVTSADPAHPLAGADSFTISGTDFGTGDIPGTESYVMIGTLKLPSDDAAISSWSDNQIVIDLPEAAKPSSVYVAVGFNKSNSVSLDINNAPALSFVSPSASITANSGAFIDWIVTDTNNDAVTVKLFYDTDSQGYDGIQLGGDFSLAVSSYIWDTSQMAEATYCIYAVYQDEHGAARSMYMPYDITIDHIYTVNNLSLYTHTASGWKYGITAPAGWKDLGFDDSSWKDAVNTRYNNTSSYMPSNLFAAKMGPEAKWISGVESKSRYYFRKLVFLDSESVKNANVKITAVGSFKLYVNGTHIGSGSNWKSLNCFDISEYAVPGLNIVCVDAVTTNAKGFTAGIFLNETLGQTSYLKNNLADETVFDTAAPEVKIFYINNNETNTLSELTELKIEAIDDVSYMDNLKMRIRNENETWLDPESGWEAFAELKEWTLSAGPGEKSVFIEVIDEANNISSAEDSIIMASISSPVDDPASEEPISDPGSGDEENNIVITGLENDIFPSAEKIWNWAAGEASQVLLFRYCIDRDPEGLPDGEYSEVSTASINDDNGDFYLHVQAKDINGNLSEVVTVWAILDNASPEINEFSGSDPADNENSLKITLDISVTDNITQTQDLRMRLRNEDEDWQGTESGWENFDQAIDWTLSAGIGNKTVFLEVMDEAKNISSSHYSLTVTE